MKLAIVGSRGLENINLEEYMPENVTEIVSGGAKGVDLLAKIYAKTHNIKYTEFLPQYKFFGKAAPIQRNMEIIDYADELLIFWDGYSKGTQFVIKNCQHKPHQIIPK